MFLERLFANVGSKIDSQILKKLVTNIKAEIKEEKKEEEMTPSELKTLQRRIEKKTSKIKGILGESAKSFAEQIDKHRYHHAVIELIDARNAVEELENEADFHALMALCYVAILKYDLAESEEQKARHLKSEWRTFEEIADNVYDSGQFFIAEQLDESPKKLKVNQSLKEDLKWDDKNYFEIIDELENILEREDEKCWRSLKAEKPDVVLNDSSTLEELIIQLCDQFILPFYARLELKKITNVFNN